MKRTYKDEAIVLRRQNIGEADRILTLFTKNHGKIKAIAKGVRKVQSKKSPHLDLLILSQIFFAKAREIDIILEAQSVEVYDGLKKSLAKMKAGLYFAELVDVLSAERQEHQEVFNLLREALRSISTSHESKVPLISRSFELKLLSLLGFWSRSRLKIEKREVLLGADILEKRSFKDIDSLSIEEGLEKELSRRLQTIIEDISERRLKTPRFI